MLFNRYKFNYLISFLILLSQLNCRADDFIDMDKINNDLFCQQIHKIKKNHLYYKSLFKLRVTPQYFGIPQHYIFNDRPKKNTSSILFGKPKRIVLFSLGPSPEQKKRLKKLSKRKTKKQQQVIESYDRQKMIFTKLVNSKSIGQCLRWQKKYSFNLTSFLQLQSEYQGFNYHQKIHEGYKSRKILSRKLKHSKINWEIRPYTDLNEFIEVINSSDVMAVMLIGHSLSNGKLIDTYGLQFPSTLFSQISPSIQLIALYSCHSEKILQAYQLIENLKSNSKQTLHLYNVLKRNKYSQIDIAPLEGIGTFLSRVEKTIIQLGGVNSFSPVQLSQMCRLSFESKIKNIQGGFSIALNNKLIGTIYQDLKEQRWHFPCQYLKGNNKISINNIHYKTLSKMDFKISKPYIDRLDHSLQVEKFSSNSFNRTDGSIRSILLEFKIDNRDYLKILK